MKKILFALVLLISSSSLYSIELTEKDLAFITALQVSAISLAIAATLKGIPLAYNLFHRIIPSPAVSPENLAFDAYQKANRIKQFLHSSMAYAVVPAAITPITLIGPFVVADLFAALYIAKKHGITYKEAYNTIKNLRTQDIEHQRNSKIAPQKLP